MAFREACNWLLDEKPKVGSIDDFTERLLLLLSFRLLLAWLLVPPPLVLLLVAVPSPPLIRLPALRDSDDLGCPDPPPAALLLLLLLLLVVLLLERLADELGGDARAPSTLLLASATGC